MNWKLTLTYDGTNFHGWQIQPNLPTIQGTLASALHQITGESTLPQGSGRTDAGVHALAQVASVALTGPIPAANLHRALNHALPPSIRILSAEPAPDHFHARHSALSKTYEYRIFQRRPTLISKTIQTQMRVPPISRTWRSGFPESSKEITPTQITADLICPPFQAPYVYDCRWPLNLPAMQTAVLDLLGTHNFTSFAATDPDLTQRDTNDRPNPTKTITHSTFTLENDLLIYRITGSGFLHHMVRNIVGTLIEIGREALPPNSIPTILAAQNRTAAGPTAPANGLYLHSVHYPEVLTLTTKN
jgi:tRNA pseudouridine38-40 synthase